ncbi:16S rRNA (cytidine(1402)-2'-O)-methyltransferase [Candidatus Roizmanbacteria bacterium CG_4_10_14_0_8_um_filter_39_9]|uniref:Ribosomal RNA small subunit methyltransferase I n=1 Tax=Candidatus Roizmanbacteria bacterium CG_4_10_14_0_8_um_filter_39_9 TaxID=1974829 RepID=A0A2M7QD50_9BACT|nr:MAG: 16S rRNA (cytidine(1402)-2'-O)-methyltransferase [Candidatus Roizmanbacteria bacterium CG_4_10_14_0_8_um_filter_39_9]
MFYIVGTPIGNLEDLSLRQARIISEADLILAEDTRRAGILLDQIHSFFPNLPNPPNRPKLISYYKDREFEKLPYIIELLTKSPTTNDQRPMTNIVLISDSGMPLISDPGQLLINYLSKHAIPFTVIPGPTALTTALVASGLKSNSFHFFGFLPKKGNELKKVIEISKEIAKFDKKTVFIGYESPNRLHETLLIMNEVIPEVHVCICRELTKKFEEVSRGTSAELMKRKYKGEIVLLFQYWNH